MDGTETKQDVETSADNQGTSNETETFTKEQVEKMVSDRLAQAGREAKSLETRQSRFGQTGSSNQRDNGTNPEGRGRKGT